MTDESNAENQAKVQAESVGQMVAALECNYRRLEELRDERDARLSDVDGKRLSELRVARVKWLDENPGSYIEVGDPRNGGRWVMEHPDEAEEIETLEAAEAALTEWELENLKELSELEQAAGDCEDQDEARERIHEDPLSVEVRSGWQSVGETLDPSEFSILLCTGGPAVRIIGELDDDMQPSRARIEYQDWGTPWTHLYPMPIEHETLLTYCREFFPGD